MDEDEDEGEDEDEDVDEDVDEVVGPVGSFLCFPEDELMNPTVAFDSEAWRSWSNVGVGSRWDMN